MKLKVVKLKNCEKYKDLELTCETLGIVITKGKDFSQVMFFNDKNQGDYLVAKIKESDLITTDVILNEELSKGLENFIHKNTDKIVEKASFNTNPFSDCDFVELIVEKETYGKYGIHKGDKGVVVIGKATQNKVLVDFGKANKEFDGMLSINLRDLRKIE